MRRSPTLLWAMVPLLAIAALLVCPAAVRGQGSSGSGSGNVGSGTVLPPTGLPDGSSGSGNVGGGTILPPTGLPDGSSGSGNVGSGTFLPPTGLPDGSSGSGNAGSGTILPPGQGRYGDFSSYLFTPFQNYTGFRFLAATAAGRQIFDVPVLVGRQTLGPAGIPVTLEVQPALTSIFDHINATTADGTSAARCQHLNFYDPLSVQCYSLGTCQTPLALVLQHDDDTLFFAKSVQKVQVAIGPEAFRNDPYCEGILAIKASVMVSSSLPLWQGPLYSYAALFNQSLLNASRPLPAAEVLRRVQRAMVNRTAISNSAIRLLAFDESVAAPGSAGTFAEASFFLNTRTPAAVAIARFLPADGDERDELPLSIRLPQAVHCEIPSVQAYIAEPVASDQEITTFSMTCGLGNYYGYGRDLSMVEAAQHECNTDDECLGIITAQRLPDEVALCFLYDGYDWDGWTDETLGERRVLYRKPSESERTCATVLNGSAEVRILVQQTALALGTVYVFDGDNVVATCGEQQPFLGRQFGGVNLCSQWYTCYAGHFFDSAVVRVVAPIGLPAGGCANALGVVFQVAAFDNVTREKPPPIQLPPHLLEPQLSADYPLQTSFSTSRSSKVSVFVQNVKRVLLAVNQTGFQCEVDGCKLHQTVLVTAVVDSNLQDHRYAACGGDLGFYGGEDGMSDQCGSGSAAGSSKFCVDAVPLGPDLDDPLQDGFTGFMLVHVELFDLLRRTSRCPFFAGKLLFSAHGNESTPPSTAAVASFPLRGNGSGVFQPFVALPAVQAQSANPRYYHSDGEELFDAAATAQAAALFGNIDAQEVSAVSALSLHNLVYPYHVFATGGAAWSSVARTPAGRGTIYPNISFACVMDWISDTVGICQIPVPGGANFAYVDVAQTSFAQPANVMAVRLVKESGAVVDRRTCGGAIGFSSLPSVDGSCHEVSQCDAGFLYDDDAKMTADPLAFLELRVSREVSSVLECAYAFAAIVTFRFVLLAKPTNCEFTCTADRQCIEFGALCDGVSDCSDNADESRCTGWLPIENASLFGDHPAAVPPPAPATVPLATLAVTHRAASASFSYSYRDCKTLAVQAQSSLFALRGDGKECIVYRPANTTELLTNPTTYLSRNDSFLMYALLPRNSIKSYPHVTNFSYCSARGKVLNLSATLLCVCDSPIFIGEHCEDTTSVASIGAIFVAVHKDSLLTPTEIASGFRTVLLEFPSLSFACEPYMPDGPGSKRTRCTLTGDDKQIAKAQVQLVVLSAVGQLNAALGDDVDPSTDVLRLFFETAAPTALACGGGGRSCPLPLPTALSAVNIDLSKDPSNAGSSTQIVLTLIDAATSRRSGGGARNVSVICISGATAEETSVNGCLRSNCVLALNGSTVSLIEVLPSASDNQASPCYLPPVVTYRTALTFPSVIDSRVANTNGDYSFALGLGLVLTLVAVVVLVGSIIFRIADLVVVSEMLAAVEQECRNSQLKKFLTQTFRVVGHYNSRSRILKTERISVALGVFSSNVLIAGIFVLLYYVTSSSYSSNTTMFVQEFRDASCEGSTIAPAPFRVTRLPPDTSRACAQREVSGRNEGSLYISGFCLNGGEGRPPVAHLRGGTSFFECQQATAVQVVTDVCVPLQTLLPDVERATFLRITCATLPSASSRFRAFQDVAEIEAKLQLRQKVTLLDRRLRQHWDDRSLQQPGKYVYRKVVGGVMSLASSVHASRFESFAEEADVTGTVSANRLVFQTSDVYREGIVVPRLAGLEAQYGADRAAFNRARTSIVMHNGDQPIGNVYNFFNGSKQLAGEKAGVLAARYYGVRGSFADVGQYFNSQRMQTDGEGFTITMNLRATPKTYGFAYAVADTREDIVDDLSPLLTKLLEVDANGLTDSAWFDNYSVYSALLVDGPSETLHFMYANPSVDPLSEEEGVKMVDLTWSLRNLELMSFFNGYWHNVVIKLRTENGQSKAQLMIDGVTSLSAPGWNQCVDRRPFPIAALEPGALYPSASVNEKLMSGGTLYTGYFNGAVANLEFNPRNVPLFDVWFQGSAAMQSHNRIDGDAFATLGAVLIVVAIVFLVIAFLTSGREIWTQAKSEENTAIRGSFAMYTDLWRKLPTDAAGDPYIPMKWSVAKHLLGLSTTEFSVFLDQLRYNFRDPPTELVRLLYIYAKDDETPDVDNPAPTAAQWLEVVHEEQDVEEVVEQGFAAAIKRRIPLSQFQIDPKTGKKRRFKTKEEDPDNLDDLLASSTMGSMKNPLELSQRDEDKKSGASGKKEQQGSAKRSDGGVVVNMGNLNFMSNQQVQTQGGDSKSVGSSFGKEIKQLIQPLITGLQSVYVWLSTLGSIPPEYTARFHGFFSFFCVDWSTAIRNIPPIATPLMQIFASLLVFALLIYFLQIDELGFAATLGRYALRRDDIDGQARGAKDHDYGADVVKGIDDPYDEFDKCDFFFEVPILSLRESQRIDQFMGRTKAGKDHLQDEDTMEVKDHDGNKYRLDRKRLTDEAEIKLNNGSKERILTSSQTVPTLDLHDISCRCVFHCDQRLRLQVQTQVWPFLYRPSCCAVMNGNVCGMSTGPLYRCGMVHRNQYGRRTLCPYALCAKHYRAGPVDRILAEAVLPFVQNVKEYGSGWLFATVFLFLANTFYTPFLKTALMILACNPYFQCLFPRCWARTNMDQQFILAVYLAVTVIIFFGFGFPLTLVFLLRRRTHMLDEIFFAEEYGSRFGDPTTRTLDPAEWTRFVTMDPTALGTLYKSFEHKWLFVPPLMLAWKVILLCPPVFMENGTFGQAVAVAAVEFCFGVFMFVTSPSINAIVDWMYKLGAIHQMAFLGIHSINIQLAYTRQPPATTALVLTTFVYLLITAIMIVYSKVAPTVKTIIETANINALMEKLAMQYTEVTGIFVVPRAGLHYVEVDVEAPPPPEAGSTTTTTTTAAAAADDFDSVVPFAITPNAEPKAEVRAKMTSFGAVSKAKNFAARKKAAVERRASEAALLAKEEERKLAASSTENVVDNALLDDEVVEAIQEEKEREADEASERRESFTAGERAESV